MFNADEARQLSSIETQANKHISIIENKIQGAANNGDYSIKYAMKTSNDNIAKRIIDILIENGYKIMHSPRNEYHIFEISWKTN